MKRTVVSLLTVGVLAWAAGAGGAQELVPSPQEKGPRIGEKLPPPEGVLPPLLEGLPHAAPGCEHSSPSVKILWMEREVPVQVLTPREVVVPEKHSTLEVAYRPVKRTVTDIVMKPREVVREVPYMKLEPCTVTDPHTGHCSTVMQPVPCTKLQKQTEFYAVPVTRTVVVQVPYLKEVEEIVPRTTLLLEYRTEMQKRPSALSIPGPDLGERRLLAPKPPCDYPEHP